MSSFGVSSALVLVLHCHWHASQMPKQVLINRVFGWRDSKGWDGMDLGFELFGWESA